MECSGSLASPIQVVTVQAYEIIIKLSGGTDKIHVSQSQFMNTAQLVPL